MFVFALSAMVLTALYVVSKVHFALAGELGVTGGPEVDPSSYTAYGPGEVAAAQWGNVAVGMLGIGALLLPLLPVARRLPRWVLMVPLFAFALLMLAGGVGMLVRALTSDVGGAAFGWYSLVWSALIAMTALRVRGREAERNRAGLAVTTE
ncbi:hypothetical protein SAMN05421630_101819 [Prauserella marina]|uniref:Uncharacterized protein n=1 Tax=Prauserella marina TaxID=530584 RepID=A0A1G6JQE3_9PSEU|nr:hypothetical protein DES30_101517 [Prauserella marina]SDC20881.1 hypothetical protein SAMN05421630_101819 [Prauserella marina]